ncbi:MAG TPA: hypothetical protein VGD67_07880 [Pseudonocardiaceae bacterium]
MSHVLIDASGRRVSLRVIFRYDPDVRSRLENYAGARWDRRRRAWSVPARHLRAVTEELSGAGHRVRVVRDAA